MGNPRKKRKNGPDSLLSSACTSLVARECGFPMGGSTEHLRRELTSRQPRLLEPTSLTDAEGKLNKAFCCAWRDADTVLVGTKCNKFLAINIPSRTHRVIPLPPAPPCRQGPDLLAAMMNGGFQQPAGIHSIAVSPCRRYVATGGQCVNDAVVFRSDTMTPMQTFMGHVDWVFGITFVTDNHFVTASRDRTIKLWQLQDDFDGYNPEPAACSASVLEHRDKVRDVCFSEPSQRLVTLAVNGDLGVWTPDLRLVQKMQCPRTAELVACCMSGAVVAVGSKNHVTMFDMRMGGNGNGLLPATNYQGVFAEMESTDHGVRSVVFKDHLLSHGTGDGQIHFHDIRYLRSPVLRRRKDDVTGSWGALPQQVHSLTIQRGHVGNWGESLQQFELYMARWFHGFPRHVACYSHAWDPSGTKLFTAGGPLACGIPGCSLQVWE